MSALGFLRLNDFKIKYNEMRNKVSKNINKNLRTIKILLSLNHKNHNSDK